MPESISRPRGATGRIVSTTAAIASGQSLSAAVDLDGATLVGIVMPASWTAAGLSFQGSADGTTFYDLYDRAGNEVTASAAQARFVAVEPALWSGVRWLKVRSGTTGTPVNQGAARTITMIVRTV